MAAMAGSVGLSRAAWLEGTRDDNDTAPDRCPGNPDGSRIGRAWGA